MLVYLVQMILGITPCATPTQHPGSQESVYGRIFPVVEGAINVTSYCQTTGNGLLMAVHTERKQRRKRKFIFDNYQHTKYELRIEYTNHPFKGDVAFRFSFAQCNSTKAKSNFDVARLTLEFALIHNSLRERAISKAKQICDHWRNSI